jgi:hypothetical protein
MIHAVSYISSVHFAAQPATCEEGFVRDWLAVIIPTSWWMDRINTFRFPVCLLVGYVHVTCLPLNVRQVPWRSSKAGGGMIIPGVWENRKATNNNNNDDDDDDDDDNNNDNNNNNNNNRGRIGRGSKANRKSQKDGERERKREKNKKQN